jgi:hypothetical protein
LGKDVLHLDATGGFQESRILLNVTPNVPHVLRIGSSNIGREYFLLLKSDNNTRYKEDYIKNIQNGYQFTPTENQVWLRLSNDAIGSFDFIRPALYMLTGQEGSINGSPIILNKHAKRRLYAKR